MNRAQPPARRAQELLDALSTSQKLGLVHQALADGAGYGAAGYVPAIASLCLPALLLNDAGSGLADEQTDVTSYPAEIAQAASWDPGLERVVGASIGAEAHAKGIDVLLAPDVNIVRTPLGGRTSEEFGEDPFLAGQLAAGYVQGVQSQHVVATVKQYDANNQETERASIDVEVSPRALAEIYQPAFAAAVQRGGAGAVMCAYNQVNGAYSCQNPTLLRTDLDGRDRFHGFVVSDWGATHSTVASARAGLDLEMDVVQEPGSGPARSGGGSEFAEDWYGAPLAHAVADGAVPMRLLNEMVERILVSLFAAGVIDDPPAAEPGAYLSDVDTAAADAVALRSAEAGGVLLKDAGDVLPLSGTDHTIAVIGVGASPAGAALADEAGGSVHVLASRVSDPLSAITARAARAGDVVVYDSGTSPAAAAALARHASVAVVFAGYVESEGVDLANLNYDTGYCELVGCLTRPSNADALIAAVEAANPRTVVVLNTGGPALMPWLARTAGVLEMWYPGQQDGAATAALLFGDVDPSGHLPVTFPASLAQLAQRSARQFPGLDGRVYYSEGLLVGYRWYEARHLRPLFPFGFGLSYTRFTLSGLRLRAAAAAVRVSFEVTNTGPRAGVALSQVYLAFPRSTGEPPQELAGFRRTALGAGRRRMVSLSLPAGAFAHFDPATGRWVVSPGCYAVRVGTSSASEALAGLVGRGGARCGRGPA